MVSLEAVHQSPLGSIDAPSSPRISFQADFLEAATIFSSIITPPHDEEEERAINGADFEFLSSNNLMSLNNNNNNENNNNNITLLTADELFCEGKILPFWQMQQHSEKLKQISLRAKEETEEDGDGEKENDPVKEQEQVMKKKEDAGESSNKVMNWLVDEDPSPRPPNCTVLWKELLRLKKQRSSSSSASSSSSSVSVLSPSSSSSSSSSSSASDTASNKQAKGGVKKLERTRSTTSIKIRPMINVPICTQVKTSSLPPLFSHKKRK